MASDSQTFTPSSASTGTFPAGEISPTVALNSGVSSGTTCSSKGMFATFMASHGRNDQDE
jgi:hypothetical protein